jgi:hypothetical protein
MKKRTIAVLMLLILGLSALAAGCSGQTTFTGYLVCQNCEAKGYCQENNTDLTEHPEKYTAKCARMAECITSGYGIAIQQTNGEYKYYPFDTDGSILALDNVIYNTKRTDNLLVEVTGKRSGDTILVQSIREK